MPGVLALGVFFNVSQNANIQVFHTRLHRFLILNGCAFLCLIVLRIEKTTDGILARELMRTCYEMYARSPSGLSPEQVTFGAGKHF